MRRADAGAAPLLAAVGLTLRNASGDDGQPARRDIAAKVRGRDFGGGQLHWASPKSLPIVIPRVSANRNAMPPRYRHGQPHRVRVSGVPQAVFRARRDGQLLTRPQREPGAVDGKRGGSGDHGKARFLDGVDVGIADAAAGREPGLVLDELAVRFRGSLQEPDPLAVEGVFDDLTDDERRHLVGVFCGV